MPPLTVNVPPPSSVPAAEALASSVVPAFGDKPVPDEASSAVPAFTVMVVPDCSVAAASDFNVAAPEDWIVTVAPKDAALPMPSSKPLQ
jgi:hypothetical protein